MKTTIYKYLDEKGALATIKGKSVLLRTPLEYNDPFDCEFSASKEETKRAFNLFLNYQLFKKLYDFLFVDNKANRQLKNIAKIHKKLIQIAASNIKKTMEYAEQSFLLFYRPRIYKLLNKKKPELLKEFDEAIRKGMVKIKKSILVCCFGSNNESILMWSHYANKHKGACIEYKIDDVDFDIVDYQEQMPEFELYKALSVVFGHEFAEEKIYDIDKYKFILSPLLTKSIDWKYEGEIRCIFSKKKQNPKIYEKTEKGKKLLLLKMPKIQAVYVGCKATKGFVNKILKQCSEIPVYKMQKAKDKYGVVVENLFINNVSKT